jgi:hypothetical protein
MQNLDESTIYLYLLLSLFVNLAFTIIISLSLRPQQTQSQISRELLNNEYVGKPLKLYISMDPAVGDFLTRFDQLDCLEELLKNVVALPQSRPLREKPFKGNYADLAAGTLD